MGNNVRDTLAAIWPGKRVILNLGLLGPTNGPNRLLPQQRTVVYATMMKEIMEPGYRAEINLISGAEPTMVVDGVFKTTANYHLMLWDTVVIAEQDCIALYYPDEEEGVLFGPNADGWGEFALAYFLFPEVQ